jgi:hypothetical protein
MRRVMSAVSAGAAACAAREPLPPALRVRLYEAVLRALPDIVLACCGGLTLLLVAWHAPAVVAVSSGLLVRRILGGRLGEPRGPAGTRSGARRVRGLTEDPADHTLPASTSSASP